MGAENEKRIAGSNGELKGKPDIESGKLGTADGNRTSASTGAGDSNSRGDTGAGDTGAGTGKAEEKKVPRLADVTDTAPIPEAPKKKTRRKKTTKKKAEASAFDSTQISALLVSISTVIASRPNLHMFALSEMEAQQIATPLSNIIAKSEKLSAAGEHADAIALVTACLVIMLPRVMIYFDTVKQKKIEANGGVKIVDNRNNKKAESAGNNRKAVGAASTVKPFDADGISSAIPSIV